MKKQLLLQLIFIFALITGTVRAQENAEWEHQTNVTGYIATEFDYFDAIKYNPKNYGLAVTEAGILASYKPLEKLEIKTVFVYRPNFSIDQMINEANAEYSFADFFKVKGGRFLTPLSPMNTYYYSPVNNSATLPMLISDHEAFPLNIDGVSVNGTLGDEFKVGYNAFFGGFYNSLWLKTGAMGFFGDEKNYLEKVFHQDTIPAPRASDYNNSLQTGGGGHLAVSYKDYITLGVGVFNDAESIKSTSTGAYGNTITTFIYLDKISYGANLKLKLNTLKLIGEYWQTKLSVSTRHYNYNGGFAELSNNFGKITPYLRYEYHSVPDYTRLNDVNYSRYTLGINYKPIFETTIKLEYMYYKYQSIDLSGVVATLIYSF